MILLLAALVADPHLVQHEAEVEMVKCFYRQAASLDDRVSGASTVAQGVVSACHSEFDDWKYASFEELRPPQATLFYRRLGEAASSMATEVVLRVRAMPKH